MARKLFGFQQLRNALRTLGYILFMYLFSISLTFYNKWFLQVCYCYYLQGTCAQINPSSETQGRLAGARGNKSGKEMKRRMFTSKAERAPGNRLLPDHFQTALPMLPPDWAEKSFVLFCPIGEQQLLRYCGVFLHDDFRIAILALFDYQCSACEGNFHFNFLRERQNIEMMT